MSANCRSSSSSVTKPIYGVAINRLTVVDSGVGEGGLGGVGLVSEGFEALVVGRALLVAESVGPLVPHAVVAPPDVEPAFRLAGADLADGAESEPGHAVSLHVGFADQPAVHARLAQMVAKGHLADTEREVVPLRAMAGGVAAGVEANPAAAADRRLGVGLGEPHPGGCDPVEVGVSDGGARRSRDSKRGPRRGLAPKRQKPLGRYARRMLRCEGVELRKCRRVSTMTAPSSIL